VEGSIEFCKVFFTYVSNQNKPIFHDFNLKINAGQSIAIVGPSGSGKSTIVRLVLRFYDPNEGEIIIDGKSPINSLNVSWWVIVFVLSITSNVNIERTFYTIMTWGIFSGFFSYVASTNRLCCARTFPLPRNNPR
jgi:ABC-type transport system involved in Fe-S cluster assembly fused permease/ATPase subunit